MVRDAKREGRRIAMLTAYDATFARIVDDAGVDVILVGDSVATVVQGEATTIPVTLEEMEYHVRMVARARTRALVVGDLPFGTYQSGPARAVDSAARLVKAGAAAVKLEGGVHVADCVLALTRMDVPVMGHVGLTPQSYHRMGGHRVQGRREGRDAGANELVHAAHLVGRRLRGQDFADHRAHFLGEVGARTVEV